MSYDYDDQNVFARILRGEIPCAKILETEHSLAFKDISPRAPVHVLVIPKGPYVNADHFGAAASDAELADFMRAVAEVARSTGAAGAAGGNGYRLIANTGADGVQEVPHYHVHLLGGRRLGRMLEKSPEE
ncbi:histidine triad nucleotide-binding protein [Limibaculum sp. M0105]|uniref:Histidine triad nucleotide-binding protein n=1 Tax=Thermohalobaculum xanthum TaxID=2753746 RepID=A0A8J7SIK8_9RHOB|nr:histidine triad nucleotide-binding protein [Thermohalobaculum xanthum]MBK0400400.1 histidine triad nucleotide-binding protein [Thermohalobaculum xanthum]